MVMRFLDRHPDWEPRLDAVAADWRGREYAFAWGRDCLGFVLAAVEAVTGEALAFDGVPPYRSAAGQARALKAMGWASLAAAADACLGPRIAPLQAHRGDIVSDGSALGVMLAAGPVIFGEGGMAHVARAGITAAWPVGRAG